MAALLCFCLWAVLPAWVHAEEPATASIAVLPADGQTRGIQMRAQTVDAFIRESAGVVWADTRVWINFYNPGQAPIVLPVMLPGPQLAPAPLPERLQVTLDNNPLQLAPLPLREDQPQIRVTTPITVPARGTAALSISYRQALPTQEGLATFAYFLTATANWSGRPESLRVTVRFDPPVRPGQILDFAPAASRHERDGLTWHRENAKATENIGLTFMTTQAWADLETARQRATSAAGLAEHAALAERYWRLATLPAPVFRSQEYFERFFPSAVDALVAGIAHPGGAPAPEIAAAHARLADFYQKQADRLSPEAATPYLQLAAAALQNALTLHPADPQIRQTADALYRHLLTLARDRKDVLAAQTHEAWLAGITAGTGQPSEQALAQGIALTLAEQAVARGDLASAAQALTDAFGSETAHRAGAPRPGLAQTRITVTTTPTHRTFSIQAIGEDAARAALLAQASRVLAGITQTEVQADLLTFTLTYSDMAELKAAQTASAGALTDLPEFALVVAALTPEEQDWRVEQQPLLHTERYVERVDLRPARAAWETRAAQLMAAAEAARATEGIDSNARLARVQAELIAADAAAWRSLAEHSRVIYRVELATHAITREWEIAAGEVRELEAQASAWRYDRLAGAAGGAALVLVLMLFFIWRTSASR